MISIRHRSSISVGLDTRWGVCGGIAVTEDFEDWEVLSLIVGSAKRDEYHRHNPEQYLFGA